MHKNITDKEMNKPPKPQTLYVLPALSALCIPGVRIPQCNHPKKTNMSRLLSQPSHSEQNSTRAYSINAAFGISGYLELS